MRYDKVLIGCPISKHKDYCIREWLRYVCTELTYPRHRYHVMVVDNSEDKDWHKEFIGLYPNLTVVRYQRAKNSTMTIQQVLAESQNKIVSYAKRNGFDSFFSHEVDNKCTEPDVIERLQAHDVPVVGAFYQHGFGEKRYHMIQKMDAPVSQTRLVSNIYRLLDFKETLPMINGKTHEVGNIGIGAMLIKMWIFDHIKFHSDPAGKGLSDSYLSADLKALLGIDILCDTSINIIHQNDSWGWKKAGEELKGRSMV